MNLWLFNPIANILVSTKKTLSRKIEKRFIGRIATGEGMMRFVIGHTQFEKIPMDKGISGKAYSGSD